MPPPTPVLAGKPGPRPTPGPRQADE